MFEDETPKWETELHERAAALVAKRLQPLQTEVERLQATIAEISTGLLQQTTSTASADETAELTAQVRSLLQERSTQLEDQFQEKLQTELELARAALRQELEAEFQTRLELSHQAGQREAAGEIEQLRQQVAGLLSGVGAASTVAPTAAPPSYVALKAAIEEVDAQRTQSETLTALIKHAAAFAPRIAFFVVKSGEAIGWKASGFENGLTDETARTLSVSIQTNALVGQALGSHHTAIALNPAQAEITPMLGRFSHPVPQGAVAVPLVVRGKAAAVLYADSGTLSDEAIQLEAIELLIQVASMAIELLPVRRSAGDMGRPPVTAPPPSAPVAAPVSAEAAPVAPPEAPEATATPTAVTTEAPVPDYAPITSRGEEPATPAYFTDPATNRPAESVSSTASAPEVAAAPAQWAAPVPSEPVNPPIASEPVAAFDAPVVPSAPDAAPVSASDFAFSPAPEQVKEVAPVVAPAHVGTEDDKPSIYDLLRMGSPDAASTPITSSLPFSGYAAPEPPVATPLSDPSAKSSSPLPTWMQRLQEEEPEPAAAPPPLASPWARLEDNYPQTPPPAPPPPPPLRLPSLSEAVSPAEPVGEAETDRLPAPPLVQPFQPESPSVRFSFSTPSEPPRYAAPSLSVSNAATETEVRAHNDARRFARLLVSEIKLYNAAKVNEGRRLSDLYDRLKDEIDRSRKVYDKRVSPAVAAKFDYFYDELVQTLAEGDPSKLGGNCPGPVVIAT